MDGDFQNMFQTAAKIKGSQMESLRKNFETWASYFQNTLFASAEVKALRELPVEERVGKSEELKAAGNDLFRDGNFAAAYDKYQAALAAFVYCESSDPDWKTKGIRDENLRVASDRGRTLGEKALVKPLLVSCYINMAACLLQSKEFGTCIRACDDALVLDPSNVKALYRRAMARTAPASAGATDYELAVRDLEAAYRADPTDAAVKRQLTDLKVLLKRQAATDKKTFGGMFDRGDIVDESAEAAAAAATMASDAKEREKVERQAAERNLDKMRAIAKQFEAQGKDEQAKELRDAIAAAEARAAKPVVDFLNPSDKMKREAKERGIDLDDPVVIAELERLQEEKLAAAGAAGVGAAPTRASAGAGEAGPPGPPGSGPPMSAGGAEGAFDVNRLPRSILAKFVDKKPRQFSEDELRKMPLVELRAHVQQMINEDEEHSRSRERRAATIKWVVMGIAMLFMLWRFYTVGVFGWVHNWLFEGDFRGDQVLNDAARAGHIGGRGHVGGAALHDDEFGGDEFDLR